MQQTNKNHYYNESERIGNILVEILALINRRTLGTKTVIVPKIHGNDQTNFFIEQPLLIEHKPKNGA